MRRLLWILLLVLLLPDLGAVTNSYQPRGIGKVLRFRVNPFNQDQGWAMTENSVQFNRGIMAGDRWRVVFTRRTYRRLTDDAASRSWTLKGVYASKRRRGHVFVTVENRRSQPEIFHSTDYGDSWRYLGFTKQVARKARRRVAPRASGGGGGVGSEEEAVDLGDLDDEGPKRQTVGTGAAGGAVFKAYFDFILQFRPGVTPLSFRNWHPILLIDYAPRPGLTFSAEVNPTPRYYQLDWEATEKFSLYVGRIQIPFDDPSPHNYFGGYLNNQITNLPNAPIFLPDIWADLGLGLKYTLLDKESLGARFYFYVVNGFGEGGADPLNEVTSYPSFQSTATQGFSVVDNNGEKAFGGRFVVSFFKKLEVGFSAYLGRWTDDGNDSRGMTIMGFDARYRSRPWLIRAGYSFFSVDLPGGASVPSFKRAGAYGEVRRSLGERVYLSTIGGILQTDDRVTDAGDQINVGGRIGYNLRLLDISLAYRYDLKATATKQGQHHGYARLVIIL